MYRGLRRPWLHVFHFSLTLLFSGQIKHDLLFFFLFQGRNEPLKKERPKWKSEYPMTEGQLRSKRDEFWDTAPAFDGRKEIWDALRAAALAAECNDLELAQAIVDGACITVPHGTNTPTGTCSATRTLRYCNVLHPDVNCKL